MFSEKKVNESVCVCVCERMKKKRRSGQADLITHDSKNKCIPGFPCIVVIINGRRVAIVWSFTLNSAPTIASTSDVFPEDWSPTNTYRGNFNDAPRIRVASFNADITSPAES